MKSSVIEYTRVALSITLCGADSIGKDIMLCSSPVLYIATVFHHLRMMMVALPTLDSDRCKSVKVTQARNHGNSGSSGRIRGFED